MRFNTLVLYFIPLIFCSWLVHGSWLPEPPSYKHCPEYIKTTAPEDTLAAVHQALLSCPNIKGLDLRLPVGGCSECPDRYNFPFKIQGGDKYPPLKELRLEGYYFHGTEWRETKFFTWRMAGWRTLMLDWYYNEWEGYKAVWNWVLSGKPWTRLRYYTLSPEQRDKRNINRWLDAMDWGQIETLAVKGFDFTGGFPFEIFPALHSLRHLELETWNGSKALQIIGGLKNNSLTGFTMTRNSLLHISPLLTLQGGSLERLELRNAEESTRAGYAYDNSELEVLRDMAPNLKHLSINLHRNGTWPLETLDVVASIPSLRTLELYLDLASECHRQKRSPFLEPWHEGYVEGCDGEDIYQRPFVTNDTSLEIFKYLRARKAGENLENVTFFVGDWEPHWDIGGCRGDWYQWFEGRKAKVVCSNLEKEAEEDWCVVEWGEEYYRNGPRRGPSPFTLPENWNGC